MDTCIHGAGNACIPCAREKLRAQTGQMTPKTSRKRTSDEKITIGGMPTGFKGRSFRTELYEKGIV